MKKAKAGVVKRQTTATTARGLDPRFTAEGPGRERGTISRALPPPLSARTDRTSAKEDGETVALRVDFADRDVLLQMDEDAFYLTDHYRAYPFMLVRLVQVRPKVLARLVEEAWRLSAPKRWADEKSPAAKADAKATGQPNRRRRATRG